MVVDPPWDQGKTGRRAARPNQSVDLDYRTLPPGDIAATPIDRWAAESAFLWLWATNSRSRASGRPILHEALELLDRWKFRYYTTITWIKPTGPCPFGPCQISTEHALFAFRGKCAWPEGSLGKLKTAFDAPVTRHNEKPDRFYAEIAGRFPGPRLDVYGRRRRPGWDAWGDEAEHK